MAVIHAPRVFAVLEGAAGAGLVALALLWLNWSAMRRRQHRRFALLALVPAIVALVEARRANDQEYRARSGQVVSVHWSNDRQWWWDGTRWRPAAEYPKRQQPVGSPPKKPPGWPWVAGGVAALVVLTGVCMAALVIVMGVCVTAVANSTRSSPRSASVPATTPTQAAANTAAPTPAPSRDGSCSPEPCANDNYGWIVSVSDVRYGVRSGNQFENPEAGNVFVTMRVTFTSKLDQEQYANPLQFVLVDGAGIKHMAAFRGPCESWQAVNVTKGATFGPRCLAFQATAGKPNGLVLVWTPSFVGGGYQIKLN